MAMYICRDSRIQWTIPLHETICSRPCPILRKAAVGACRPGAFRHRMSACLRGILVHVVLRAVHHRVGSTPTSFGMTAPIVHGRQYLSEARIHAHRQAAFNSWKYGHLSCVVPPAVSEFNILVVFAGAYLQHNSDMLGRWVAGYAYSMLWLFLDENSTAMCGARRAEGVTLWARERVINTWKICCAVVAIRYCFAHSFADR